ncbi:MAG: ABC transporter substrate-binding protein [Streptosporangiales bacterium]|nr:ABC transporter substrate-binding protein [Streptosporangiales bacterium]
MLPRSMLRRAVPLLVGSLLVVAGAGCGASDADSPAGAATRDAPVTVKHRFGSTELDTVPQRIVTVDMQWTDVMLAMGVTPVGYTRDSLMPKSGVPWQRLPAKAKALSLTDGVPVEQIAALEPDLIVGTFSIADKETYDVLADIAPTIGALDAQQVTPWQDLVRTAGTILDDPSKATAVVDSVDRKVSAVAREMPGLEGKTFALAQYIVGDAMYVVADEKDGSSVLFQQLGMRLYPPVVREGKKARTARVNVSTERADLLRADLLPFLVNGGDESDLADIPGFDELPGTVAVLDYATVVGLNTPSPLSIPYVLKELRPYLGKAAKAKK